MTFLASDKSHNFLGQYDLEVNREWHLEQWLRDVPPIRWQRIIHDPRLFWDSYDIFDGTGLHWDKLDSADDLYNEHVNKRFHSSLELRIRIKKTGHEQELKKLGITETKPAIAIISHVYLEAIKIGHRFVGIGDILEFEGHEFIIDTMMPDYETAWLSSSIPFMSICKLNTVDRQGV